MESLIVGLILSLVTGLTYIAYKHPKSFPKIERPIRWITLLVYTALNIFQLGMTMSRGWIQDAIFQSKKLDSIAQLTASSAISEAGKTHDLPLFTMLIVYLLIAIFMIVLTNLPKLLDLDSKEDTSNK